MFDVSSASRWRRWLAAPAMAATLGLVLLGAPAYAQTGATQAARPATGEKAIRPFHVNVTDEVLADLRKRVLATRWPDKETVNDQSQGM